MYFGSYLVKEKKNMFNVCIYDACSTGTHRYCYEHSFLNLHMLLHVTAVLSIEISNYYMTPTLYGPDIPISRKSLPLRAQTIYS